MPTHFLKVLVCPYDLHDDWMHLWLFLHVEGLKCEMTSSGIGCYSCEYNPLKLLDITDDVPISA